MPRYGKIALESEQVQLIKTALEQEETTYKGLKAMLPQNPRYREEDYLIALRKINQERAKERLKSEREPYRKMPSTALTIEHKIGDTEIILYGIRHGALRINTETAKDLQKKLGKSDRQKAFEAAERERTLAEIKELSAEIHGSEGGAGPAAEGAAADERERSGGECTKQTKLLVEQGLNRRLNEREIATGTEIGDVSQATRGFRARLFFGEVTGLPSLAFDRLTKRRREHYYGNDYDLIIQACEGTLPEKLETEVCQSLPADSSVISDKGYRQELTDNRSAYMAGVITGVAERPSGNVAPIAFVCGGGHLPRVDSCLGFAAAEKRDGMPPLWKKHFNKGYAHGMQLEVQVISP